MQEIYKAEILEIKLEILKDIIKELLGRKEFSHRVHSHLAS